MIAGDCASSADGVGASSADSNSGSSADVDGAGSAAGVVIGRLGSAETLPMHNRATAMHASDVKILIETVIRRIRLGEGV